MKHLSIAIVLALTCSFVGCGPSEAELQAQAEQAEQERIEREKAEREQRKRQAMLDAIAYDNAVSDQVYGNRTIGEVVFGPKDETVASYVRNLKRVPLDDCPADFREAYEVHIEAWESRNEERIKGTWMDVLAIARLHGVTVPE